jgi:hypothetical protein
MIQFMYLSESDGEEAGVTKLDAMPQVEAMHHQGCLVQMIKTHKLIMSLHPGID